MKIGVAIAIALVGLATPAHADPNFDPGDPDSMFRYLLDYNGALFDFNLEKHQGQRACQDYRGGKTLNDVVHDLMSHGAYSFDVASAIVASALPAYCLDVPVH